MDRLDSSDEETPDDSEARAMVGVSIGEKQSRLASPKTPAAEKAAAIDERGGFFSDVILAPDGTPRLGPLPAAYRDGPDCGRGADLEQNTVPWRDGQTGGLREGTVRRESGLGGLARLSSNAKPHTIPDKAASAGAFRGEPVFREAYDGTSPPLVGNSMHSATNGTPEREAERSSITQSPTALIQTLKEEPVHSRGAGLRRTTSHNSLLLHRTLSTASSLGDDSRFEHVQEQVNSRFKAIRDSLQDANFRLPALSSLPKAPNLSFAGDLPSVDVSAGSRARAQTAPSQEPKNGASKNGTPNPHPFFTEAITNLKGDLVILGGYRGSNLRSAEPPHRRVWVPIKVGLNLRKVDLEVGLNPEDEETMHERIIPSGMLTHIGPVDMSRRLLKRLRHSENAQNGSLRVHDYGYDWRLSPHRLSAELIRFLEGLRCNIPGMPASERGATIIAHSLGGLITRHVINQRPELIAGVIYSGVPQSCVNILGPLRKGDDVLLSSRVLTAQVNFSIRTSFALLPLDGRCFIDKETKEEYPVDFFNVDDWIEHRFSPCIAPPLPALPPNPGPISSMIDTLTNALPFRRPKAVAADTRNAGITPQMSSNPADHLPGPEASVATTVTLPRAACLAYLWRILPEIKHFKQELAFNPAHATRNAYPPAAVIYGKSVPTVYGARVRGRDGIARADAYDDLVFASGDGVVLARAAMLPPGYRAVRGGVVASERGHVTLLGDLEAVGRCLIAVAEARKAGVGLREGITLL
ncbi:hypothetical protein EJ06DRAFT_539968 [Trichodelitschia bisporula]|uniref:Alpha/beta-hydrolase n=1 Tax=Trichodelitschia bisporula TaxID=703511 RepID=A0A6G1HKE4_9PEZI|nr:hypothetical protein EJ06DRAFT_539968 [Trichodelitschia bisporula]